MTRMYTNTLKLVRVYLAWIYFGFMSAQKIGFNFNSFLNIGPCK